MNSNNNHAGDSSKTNNTHHYTHSNRINRANRQSRLQSYSPIIKQSSDRSESHSDSYTRIQHSRPRSHSDVFSPSHNSSQRQNQNQDNNQSHLFSQDNQSNIHSSKEILDDATITHTHPNPTTQPLATSQGQYRNWDSSQSQMSSKISTNDDFGAATVVSEKKRMALYSIGIFVISLLIFSGIGYAVFTAFGKRSSDAETTANSTSSQNNTNGKNGESFSVFGPDTQTAPIKAAAKEELPTVDNGFTVDQVYTNTYFPDTSVAYSGSWNYTNVTALSQYANLITRTITLSKDTSQLTVAFKPKIVTGCSQETADLLKIKDIPGSNLSRYRSADPGVYYYLPSTTGDSFNSDCVALTTQIVTTIDSANAPEYAATFAKDTKVTSFAVITLQTILPQDIAQADAMIAKSRFNILLQ